MPLDFYNHVISPPARACIITAKHLGLELNIKAVDLFGGATRAPEYLKVCGRGAEMDFIWGILKLHNIIE